MKKIILIAICLSSSFITFSQDIITKKNGEDLKVKITEVNQTDIKYKKTDNPSGPTFIISKSDALMIRYEDGSKDMFNEVSNTNNANNSDMYSRGKEDAIMNYRGKNSGAGGTGFAVALTSPLIGLIPAIACSSTEPSDENLKYTNRELMRNADYNRGYREQAHKTKRRKIWTAFGIGSAAWLLLVILLSSGG
jgi:hypothetical protein